MEERKSELYPPVAEVAVLFRVQHYIRKPNPREVSQLLVNHLRLEANSDVLRNIRDVSGQIHGHVLAVRAFGENEWQ